MRERPGLATSRPVLTANAWLRFDVIARLLEELEGVERVLEIGAGQGALGVRLARRYEYVGLEPDPGSFSTARERLQAEGRGQVLQERSSAYGASHPFDLVCAFEVLEHAEDDLEAVSEWSRFLHPGGWLLVSVPAFASRWGPIDVIVGHHRRYEPEGIMRLFLAAGLHRPRVELYGFPLGYVLEAARDGLAKVTKQADREAATARSGRLFQPPESLAWVMKAGTEPFRRLQRTSFGKRHGTGLIALGQRPPS